MMKFALLLLSLLLFTGCQTSRIVLKHKQNKLEKKISNSKYFQQTHTGFVLYDPKEHTFLAEYQKDKYFTPASNTKILTFLAAERFLDKKITGLRYYENEDTIFFQGTGDPSFLHPDFTNNRQVYDFLIQTDKKLVLQYDNFDDNRFGPGWSWDDYQYGFQVEKSAFPIYGNVIKVSRAVGEKSITVSPSYFRPFFHLDEKMHRTGPKIIRNEQRNYFRFNTDCLYGPPFVKEIPFYYSPELFVSLLQDTLHKEVTLANAYNFDRQSSFQLKSVEKDSLFKSLLQDSDNFIAEQLLLLISDKTLELLNTKSAIDYIQDSMFSKLKTHLFWLDGSGLSRYNQIQPEQMVQILGTIYRSIEQERIFNLFPAGGVSGTIANNYKGDDGPFVFAKTGTMTRVHSLSGFVLTHSGKVLIFSFMHEGFSFEVGKLKTEMEVILKWIHENY